jgi:hypothetical protein
MGWTTFIQKPSVKFSLEENILRESKHISIRHGYPAGGNDYRSSQEQSTICLQLFLFVGRWL